MIARIRRALCNRYGHAWVAIDHPSGMFAACARCRHKWAQR